MNGAKLRIEIFEPFGAAYEWMKGVLFRPFDFTKWLVLGFAAFLSGKWGNGFNFRLPLNGNWNARSSTINHLPGSESLPPWVLPIIAGLAVLLVVVVFVLMWIVSRGRFIFMDCVVKNQAAIVAPWREYRREGNSYFWFSLAVMLLVFLTMALLGLLVAVPLGLFGGGKGTNGLSAVAVSAFVFIGLVWVAFAIFFAVVSQLMIPVMYRRRCLAREAFFDMSKLILANPGPFILYVLFGIVLFMAFIFLGAIVTCLTCCFAGLPYVSSVVFLPVLVWLLAFELLFLRQFGPAYDVWTVADRPELEPEPMAPPVQPPEPPPSLPPSPTT